SYDYLRPQSYSPSCRCQDNSNGFKTTQAINEERVAFCSILRAIEKLSVALAV
ncbi:hypothetical protein M9458_014498, partial [Cirrhinus mrigala]